MCTSEEQSTPRNIPIISCKSLIRKIDFSTLSVSPTSPVLNTRRSKNISTLSVLNTENTSPILNSRKKRQNLTETECLITSPVLHTRRIPASPVINSKEITKLRKQQKVESNKKINCVRKLQYETEDMIEDANKDILCKIQTVENFDRSDINLRLNFNSEHIKEPVEKIKTNTVFNDNFKYKKRKRKRNYGNYKKINTYDEKIEIEPVCSQEIADKIENSIIEKLESPRNIFKNVTINKQNNRKIWNSKPVQEQIQDNIEIELVCSQKNEECVIEMVNSQEISKPSEIFATKFQPQEQIILETSQNSFTPKSNIIETDFSQNESDQKIVIEESQSSFALSNISNCTVVQDSFEKSSDEYIWSPIKKKKYKPGTYSHKFQRILRKQKANTAIWKHELYLAKSTNYEIPVSEDDVEITIVEICKINTDYGMSILECVEENSKEKCLVIGDLSQVLSDIVLRVKDLIKIFPPYFIEYLKMDQCDMKTYVNVHKILKCT